MGNAMLRGIRSRLLGLVVGTVIPFVALIGVGLWSQWRSDEATAIQRALDDARLLAAQVDDLIGNLDNLLIGLAQAVSWDPADTAANDALLRRAKTELPSFVANIFIFDLKGNNIGSSVGPEFDRFHVANRSFFQKILSGKRFVFGGVMIATASGRPVVPVSRAIYDDNGRLR